MRKHIILFFSALLFLFACNDEKQTKGLLTREQLTSLLVDIHIVDGSLANQSNVDSIYHNGSGRYFYVFEKHHTDSAQFKKSLAYYTSKPDIAISMYEDIVKILQAKSDSVNALVAKENEVIRKKVEAEQLKAEKHRLDSLAKKGIKPAPGGLNSIGRKRREEMSRPLPAPKPNPKFKNFKRGL